MSYQCREPGSCSKLVGIFLPLLLTLLRLVAQERHPSVRIKGFPAEFRTQSTILHLIPLSLTAFSSHIAFYIILLSYWWFLLSSYLTVHILKVRKRQIWRAFKKQNRSSCLAQQKGIQLVPMRMWGSMSGVTLWLRDPALPSAVV